MIAPIVVVFDVILNHFYYSFSGIKSALVISFSFQDSPEAFHRSIVDALANARHTMYHLLILKLLVKYIACVLKSSVRVKNWSGSRVGFNSFVECVINKRIVVAVTDGICDYSAIIQIQNSAEIYLLFLIPNIILELSYVGQPFLIRFVSMEIAREDILCNMLRIFVTYGTAFIAVLDGGFNTECSADTKYPVVTYRESIVTFKVITNPAISFLRIFFMNSLDVLCKNLIKCFLPGNNPVYPLVV